MDTDSAYISFSNENPFPNLIKPELLAEYEADKDNWFPRDTHKAFDKRKAGLFKEEWRGNAMVSLSSKNYICYEPDEYNKLKVSSKGVQKNRNEDILSPDGFESVIENQIVLKAENRGFRIDNSTSRVITYTQTKNGIGYYYDKRRVLSDGINTMPLDI